MSLDIYLVSEKGRQNVHGYWIDEGEILSAVAVKPPTSGGGYKATP